MEGPRTERRVVAASATWRSSEARALESCPPRLPRALESCPAGCRLPRALESCPAVCRLPRALESCPAVCRLPRALESCPAGCRSCASPRRLLNHCRPCRSSGEVQRSIWKGKRHGARDHAACPYCWGCAMLLAWSYTKQKKRKTETAVEARTRIGAEEPLPYDRQGPCQSW
jgi:hypothetical protein